MTTITVSPTTVVPTHHIKLSDGSTSLGFILRSGGRIDPRAISRRPRQNGQYSPFTQSDWGGGRGIKDAQSDRSRYADGKRAITRHQGTVMIGPQEVYTTGYRQAEAYMPGKLTWQSLLSGNRYVAYQVTASATGNRSKIYIWVRRRGTPTSTLTVELCSNSGGSPGTVLKTVTATTTNITDTISQLYEFAFASVQAVTSATVYWVKIYTSTADSASNYWDVGTDAADTNNLTKASSNGSSWSACAYDLYFRMVDDTEQLGALFFNYKGQIYFLTRPSGSNAPKLYINGYRGVATGSHSTTTLQDTTAGWTVNDFANAVLLIYSGTNSEWNVPYRTISSNTSTTLTFSPAFPKAPVSADTIYIVLGSNTWTEITGHGLTVLPTSVAVLGDVCYFAQGDGTFMRRMREYLNNVTWTREFAQEDNYAKFLIPYGHSTKGQIMGKANDYDNSGRSSFALAGYESWGRRLKFPQLINDCEATTGWTAGANATVATDNAAFMTKTKSIKITVSAGPANPVAYFAPAASVNISGQRALRLWIRSNANRAAGDIKIFPSLSATAASTIQDLSVPALVAGEWQQVTLQYIDSAVGLTAILSIGIRVTAASGTYWIDGIETVPSGSEIRLPGEKVTGLERYGDPEVPWVFLTQGAGAIEEGVFNPIPLRELSMAESVHNGMGHVVHNVYLFFSFLGGVERFYRNNQDDVGPNRDEGFPDSRRGYAASMMGYIGRFFSAYDGGNPNYSSILESANGTDWHEVYRCDTTGRRIRNLFIQVVPGTAADRLWFTEGDDVNWLYLPGNTLKENTDATFRFTHEAMLETGWITGTEPDAVKLFQSVKLFLEGVTSNRKIEWDYMKNDETTWTNNATAFTTTPVQKVVLNISAKRIKLRFRLQTNDNTVTPILRSMIVTATTRPETRYTYSMNTLLADAGIDLQGVEDTSLSAATIQAQLDTWMEANTVLTMNSVFSPFDNKTVFLEPVPLQPQGIVFDESAEKLLATLILIEP